MKKNGNLLIIAGILCILCLVEIDSLAWDRTWSVWPLIFLWGILLLWGLLRVPWEKCKRHGFLQKDWRKSKKGKILTVIFVMIVIISIAIQMISIRNTKDTVKDLKRNQAAMAMTCGISTCVGWHMELYVVNREGRWKKIRMYSEIFEKLAGGDYYDVELTAKLMDDIIKSPHIPFEPGDVDFSEEELNRAIRRQDVSCYYHAGSGYYIEGINEDYTYYAIQGTRNRKLKVIGGNRWTTDKRLKKTKEVYALYATYEKWIDAIHKSKKERTQNPVDVLLMILFMVGVFFILGNWEGCLLRGWWQQPSMKRCISNTVFAIILLLVNILGQGLFYYKQMKIIPHTQFVLCVAFTMGIWSFWELISWRKHCGIKQDYQLYKSLYHKGNAFLVTMGCSWLYILLEYYVVMY